MPGWWKSEMIGRIALVGMVILGLSRVALAEPEAVHIDYAAPAGCPDTTAFLRALQNRTTRFREAATDEPARKFLAWVRAAGASFSGRLEIRGPDGRTAVRTVDAAVCQEVASALALITALTIDPDALTGARRDPPFPAPALPTTVAEVSRPWRWSAGLLGHATFLVSPNVGYGGELFVEADPPTVANLGSAVRMAVLLTQSDVGLPSGAAARFQWALMGIEGCPVRLGGSRLAIQPCVALRLGVIHGEGRGISHPLQTVSLWSEAGLVLRLCLALTDRLRLEGQGGMLVPLRRTTFEIVNMGAPTTAYAVPRFGGSAGIGIAYQFQ